MKSRLGILEELDIKCGQLSRGHSSFGHLLRKNFKDPVIMVKGTHLLALLMSVGISGAFSYVLQNEVGRVIYNNNGLGSYSFEYKTADGSYRREEGGLSDSGSMLVRGEYGFIDPNGRHYSVKYIADDHGFQTHDDDSRFNDRRIV